MRKSFTRLFGFLLLNVMMLFSFGLYAQETQSTVELKAPTIDVCYNAGNSYTATVTTRDFIKMRSFHAVLSYDQTEFGVTSVSSPNALLGGSFSYSVNQTTGKVTVDWTTTDSGGTASVTIGDNAYASLFNVNFNVLGFPNNAPDNLFDSPLTWDAASAFYFGQNYTGSYQVGTNAFASGSMNVGVTYGALTANDYTISSTNCYGSNVILTITNPVGTGLQYSFDNGLTWSATPSASVVAPSTVNIRIKNASGCYSHVTTVDVTAPAPLVMTAPTTANAICNGQKGSIVFNYTGGVAPYVYYVVPQAQMNDVLALQVTQGAEVALEPYKQANFNVQVPAGSYYIAMTAGNCNQNLFSLTGGNTWVRGSSWYGSLVTITEPVALPAPTWNPLVNNTCYGGMTGSIDVAGAPYASFGTVSATINGVDWVTIATGFTEFTGLAAGTYTVTVKNATGCTNYAVATVTQPAQIVFTPSYTDATCVTASNTTGGSIYISDVSQVGGTSVRTNYQYAYALAGSPMPTSGWQTLTADATSAGAAFTDLEPNYYSVWVRLGTNTSCVSEYYNPNFSGNVLPIQAPGALGFTTNADDNKDVLCNPNTFTLAVTATGGSNSYTYSFNGGTATKTATFTTGSLNTDTTVNVSVTDSNGCTVSRVVTINVPTPLTLAITGDVVSPTCKGNNDGRVVVTAGGGTVGLTGIGGYQYSTDGLIWFDSNVIAIPEGTTTVTVKDANDCKKFVVVNVAGLPASTITATQWAAIDCFGAQTGTISVTTTSWISSTPARNVKYYYASTQAAVFTSGTVFAESGSVSPTVPTKFKAGTYYVGAMDEFGCMSNIVPVVVKEKAQLLMAPPVIKDATCIGNTDGTITISTTGGNGRPKFYYANSLAALSAPGASFLPITTWTDATATKTAQGSQVIQVQKGTYYVAITDDCGKTVTSTAIEVGGYDAINIAATTKFTVTNPTCHVTPTAAAASVSFALVSGGKVGYDFAKTGTAGNYTYKLTKASSGTWSSTVTGAYNANVTFTGLTVSATTETYTLTVSDGSGCGTYTLGSIVVANPKEVKIESTAVTHFTCKDSRDGRIVVTATGGTKPYQLAVNAVVDGVVQAGSWLDFSTGTDSMTATSKTYIATQPGVYNLTVRDSKGCEGSTVSVTVLEPAALTLTGVTTDVTCADGGSVKLSLGGGWTPAQVTTNYYTFTLVGDTYTSTANVTSTSTATTYEFTGLPVGNYTATVTDNSEREGSFPELSCSVSYKFSIKDVVPYQYKATVTNTSCIGSSTGSLKVDVLAGTATNTQYYVQLTTSTNPTLTSGGWKLTTGTGTATRTVTFADLPHAIYNVWISNGKPFGANPYDQDFCLLPTGTETPTAEGVFTKVAGWEINDAPSGLTASVTLNNDVTCNGGTDGKFTVNAAGGWGGYTYAVKLSLQPDGHEFAPVPAATEFVSSPVFTKGAGTYVIWVKDQNGCVVGGEGTPSMPIDAYRVRVKEPKQVTFVLSSSPVDCYGTATGKVMVSNPSTGVAISDAANGGTGTYTINISGIDASGAAVNITATLTGTTNTTLTVNNVPASVTGNTATATFKVTVTDANGCTNSGTVIVRQNTELKATMKIASGSFLCPGDVSGVVEAVAQGGSLTYDYRLWRNGAAYSNWTGGYPSFIVQAGYTYKIEVKDAKCSTFTEEKTINEPVGITATMQETTCFGDLTASVIIKAVGNPGRTFQYQYKANTAANYSAWAAVTDQPVPGFIFANELVTQNFYYFNVKDDLGCTTSFTYSFVPTQNELQATVAGVGGSASVTITGGISPYSYQVGTASKTTITGSVSGGSYAVAGLVDGTNTITIFDNHGCSKVVTYVADLMAPTATYSPNGTTTPTTDNHPALVITFSENVAVGTGNITIRKKSDGEAAIAAIPASAITVSGKTATVTYAGGLDKSAEYYVTIDNGVVKDLAGNAFAGVTASTTWTFKTGDSFVTGTDPKIDNSLEFKVYPNPFVDYVNIDNASELSKVVVSNIAGQVVKEVVNPESTIQLNQLVSGVYFISLYEGNTVVKTVKIVKR